MAKKTVMVLRMDSKTNNSQTGASPVTAVSVELPEAFRNHDPKMKPAALQLAIATGAKHPEIVHSVVELASAMQNAGEKYYRVLHVLRAAKLQKKEVTALLLGLGIHKSRASQLNALSSCKDEVWKKYSEKAIGFRAALELENGEEPKPSDSDESKKKRVKAKIHPVPKPIQTALAEAVAGWEKPNKAGKRTEYGFTVERDGITLYFQIFADKAD